MYFKIPNKNYPNSKQDIKKKNTDGVLKYHRMPHG